MKVPPPLRLLLALYMTCAFATCAHAAVSNVAWYRLGENDPGAASGLTVTNTTATVIGVNHLKQYGSPLYTGAVSSNATGRVGSVLAVQFNGTSQYLSNAVVSTVTDNFGIEAWVKPDVTNAGFNFIAYNGNTAANGWGIARVSGTYRAWFGNAVQFGTSIIVTGAWAHVAVVRSNGLGTLYVNGVPVGSHAVSPFTPAGGLAIGAHPQGPAGDFFNGAIDEVRVFTFASGQFSTNDLLFNVRSLVTLAATGITTTNATLNGSMNPVGFPTGVWFQWGSTTNYGNITSVQTFGANVGQTNFSHVLDGLITGTAYHFRAVSTNNTGTNFGGDLSFTTLPSTNANLLALTLSSGGFSPAFNSNVVSYSTEVTNTTTSVTVTPTSADTNATIQVQVNGGGFSGVTSGSPSGALALNVGPNPIEVRVTAQDGSTMKTYALTVTRLGKTDAYLSTLTLSSGAFTPAFDSNVVSYAASVSNATASVTVTPTSADTDATIQVQINSEGFFGVFSGSASPPLFLNVGANLIEVRVAAQDNTTIKTYILTITRAMSLTPLQIAQQAYVKASPNHANGLFGRDVAISGDTVVVGSPGSPSTSEIGWAYVFVRSGTNWIQQALLTASNAELNDDFGYSVSVSGDTIVVGAHQEDSNATGVNGDQFNNSAPNSGAAYVFVRSGTNWTQQAYVKASNGGGFFGRPVAIAGDTIVVGANAESSPPSSGAAYVFVRNGTNWTQQAFLKRSGPGGGFGRALAISGNTVVIGPGGASVFVRDGTNWTQQAELQASNSEPDDAFGFPVAVSGDTVAVGASDEDSNATGVNGDQNDNSVTNSGATYVFVRNGTNWSQQAYLKASNTEADDNFGFSVAISGDAIVAGAFPEDSNATGVNGNQGDNSASSAGAAYVFVRSGTNWNQQAYLKASNTDTNDSFAFSVAVSGDTVIVGAPGESSGASGINGNQNSNNVTGSGAAYIFTGLGLGYLPSPYLMNPTSSGGNVQFTFTNTAGAIFTVLTATNVALPLSNWTVLGSVTNAPSGSGQFQFTDPQATNSPQRFYRVRWP